MVSNTDTVVDIDGNVYHTVTIGTQTWMVENLKVTRYSNGDTISNVPDASQWTALTTGAYSNFQNDPSQSDIFGRLYNWYVINDERKIAPEGWHVPGDSEWNILENYLDKSVDTTLAGSRGTDIGCQLKEIGFAHWTASGKEGNNTSGFTALPGGMRRSSSGEFGKPGEYAHWWTSTPHPEAGAWCRDLYYKSCQVGRGNALLASGFSIRCIKDN
jgi:uncharacterized protein (TIGR02145 family)